MTKSKNLIQLIEKIGESYPDRIKMFDTENDTDKWVLAIDGLFGFVSSKKEAEDAVKAAIPSHFDDSGFRSLDIIPPHWKPKSRWDSSKPLKKISDYKPINILDFLAKWPDRDLRKFKNKEMEKGSKMSAKDRLYRKREAERTWDFLSGSE